MSHRGESDADLLARVPAPDAVAELYDRHVDAVFRFAVRRARDPEDVADLVATVFVELFSAAASFDRRRGEHARGCGCGPLPRRPSGTRYRRLALQIVGVGAEFRDDEYERVEQMIDAARRAPAVERALSDRLTGAERDLFLLVADGGLTAAQRPARSA